MKKIVKNTEKGCVYYTDKFKSYNFYQDMKNILKFIIQKSLEEKNTTILTELRDCGVMPKSF